MAHPQRIFLLAGEPSGDLLGGRLISAMRALGGDQLEFFGVGGSRMADQGMSSLFPMDELSLMGFAEVLPHLPRLIRRLGETRREIERRRPALALTIDSPGFALRLQRQLKAFPLARVHYVAPQVWAWRQSRAARIATDIDHLLALLPFEAPFFERHGLPCSFVRASTRFRTAAPTLDPHPPHRGGAGVADPLPPEEAAGADVMSGRTWYWRIHVRSM
jgi:lipid-A-disaccharide synthase